MHEADRIREHIQTVRSRDDAETRSLVGRIQRACWPGGSIDRTSPNARRWLAHWRPAQAAGPVPACSCSAGRCLVCN